MVLCRIFYFLINDNCTETDSCLVRLEAQVAELTQGARETGRVSVRLGLLENQVDRKFGSLEGFLNKIRIDDTLHLVPEMRGLYCPPQDLIRIFGLILPAIASQTAQKIPDQICSELPELISSVRSKSNQILSRSEQI